jgi:hypothetical protein
MRLPVQPVYELSEPRGIENEYISQKNGRQRQEENDEVDRQNGGGEQETFRHGHGLILLFV